MEQGFEPLRIGVSACLLGQAVRYDGGHKRDAFVTEVLGPFVEYEPVCPEAELGLGTPREPLRLTGQPAAPRLITIRTGIDHTDDMNRWAAARVRALRELRLDGYILKSKSPSCGMARVKVYGDRGTNPGAGLFAMALAKGLPRLPVEEEGRLHDPHLRESFVVRALCFRRWRAVTSWRHLIEFHTRHRLLLMSRSKKHLRALDRLVAEPKTRAIGARRQAYEEGFFEGMHRMATTKKHMSVLQHVMGHLRRHLDAGDRGELEALIDRFQRGELPRVVPITLILHHVHKHEVPYLMDQLYLAPHPPELMLLNHV